MYHVAICTNISYESCFVDVRYVLNIMYSKNKYIFRSVDTVQYTLHKHESGIKYIQVCK